MNTFIRESFLELVRLGVGVRKGAITPNEAEWGQLKALADEQGLFALVLDGVEKLPKNQRPPKADLLQWIGETLQIESQNAVQQKAALEMALLFHNNFINTYVLKVM